jgi:hypothetical protein
VRSVDQENSINQYFTMPSPIGDNVFGPAYQAGARIHSNSWGGAYNGKCDAACAYLRPNMLYGCSVR